MDALLCLPHIVTVEWGRESLFPGPILTTLTVTTQEAQKRFAELLARVREGDAELILFTGAPFWRVRWSGMLRCEE